MWEPFFTNISLFKNMQTNHEWFKPWKTMCMAMQKTPLELQNETNLTPLQNAEWM